MSISGLEGHPDYAVTDSVGSLQQIRLSSLSRPLPLSCLRRANQLLETIDQTIQYLVEGGTMDDHELYRGFDRKIEDFFVAHEGREEEEFLTTLKNRELSSDDKQGLAKRANAIYREAKVFVDQGVATDSPEVQKIIERHFHLLEEVHPITRETYLAYARLYRDHPRFRAAFDGLDARLADFFARAIELYAQTVR